MIRVGTKVKHLDSRNEIRKVVAWVPDSKGGVVLDRPVLGHRYWNVADLIRADEGKKKTHGT